MPEPNIYNILVVVSYIHTAVMLILLDISIAYKYLTKSAAMYDSSVSAVMYAKTISNNVSCGACHRDAWKYRLRYIEQETSVSQDVFNISI